MRSSLSNTLNIAKLLPFRAVLLVMMMVAVGIAGYHTFIKKGLDHRFPGYDFNRWVDLNMLESYSYYGETKNLVNGCDFIDRMPKSSGLISRSPPEILPICYEANPKAGYRVALWGDSFAQMLTYGLIKNLPSSWQLLQLSSRGCQASIFAMESSMKDYCQQSNFFALKTIAQLKPDVVVISQNSSLNQQNINLISQKLHDLGVKKVIYVDKPPMWKGDLPKLIFRKEIDAHALRNRSQLEPGVMNQVMRDGHLQVPNQDRYINTAKYFCNMDGCLVRVGLSLEKSITAVDKEHLTPAASDYFSKVVLIDAITKK